MDWRNSSSTKLEAGNMQIVPTIEDRVFDASVLVEFTCAICLHLIEDPRQCRYGHNICYKCFLELTKHPHLRSECPTCRAPMDKLEPNRNLVLETLLAKLDIYCRYHFMPVSATHFNVDPEGCDEHMNRQLIEAHENDCGYAFVECPHSAQCGSMRRHRLSQHEEACPYKPVTCPHCGKGMLRNALAEHIPACPELPLECQHCHNTIPQKRMKRHLERDCCAITHACPYTSYGCDAGELDSFALSAHLVESAADHLELVHTNMSLNIKTMENKFMKMLAIKDAEIEELRRYSRNRYRFLWDLHWTHTPGDTTVRAYTSETFDIFGRKFYLALWPIGEPKDESGGSTGLSSVQGLSSAIGSDSHNNNNNNNNTNSNGTNAPTPHPTIKSSPRSASSTMPTPSPPISASPRSFSSQLFDRIRTFGRGRSSSLESNSIAPTAVEPPKKTWVAVYLMMENEQPAPPASTAAPHIYSPISGLVSGYSPHHDPTRTMNVSLTRRMAENLALPMRPPETMLLEYTLRIVNNDAPMETKSSYFETTFPVPNGNGWGEEKFIETARINRGTGFLSRQDILHVQCDIQVRQCTFDV